MKDNPFKFYLDPIPEEPNLFPSTVKMNEKGFQFDGSGDFTIRFWITRRTWWMEERPFFPVPAGFPSMLELEVDENGRADYELDLNTWYNITITRGEL